MPMIWSVLPHHLRLRTRPVAAADYWLKTPLRAFAGAEAFRAVLIDRRPEARTDDPMEASNPGRADRRGLADHFPRRPAQSGARTAATVQGRVVQHRQHPARCRTGADLDRQPEFGDAQGRGDPAAVDVQRDLRRTRRLAHRRVAWRFPDPRRRRPRRNPRARHDAHAARHRVSGAGGGGGAAGADGVRRPPARAAHDPRPRGRGVHYPRRQLVGDGDPVHPGADRRALGGDAAVRRRLVCGAARILHLLLSRARGPTTCRWRWRFMSSCPRNSCSSRSTCSACLACSCRSLCFWPCRSSPFCADRRNDS